MPQKPDVILSADLDLYDLLRQTSYGMTIKELVEDWALTVIRENHWDEIYDPQNDLGYDDWDFVRAEAIAPDIIRVWLKFTFPEEEVEDGSLEL